MNQQQFEQYEIETGRAKKKGQFFALGCWVSVFFNTASLFDNGELGRILQLTGLSLVFIGSSGVLIYSIQLLRIMKKYFG